MSYRLCQSCLAIARGARKQYPMTGAHIVRVQEFSAMLLFNDLVKLLTDFSCQHYAVQCSFRGRFKYQILVCADNISTSSKLAWGANLIVDCCKDFARRSAKIRCPFALSSLINDSVADRNDCWSPLLAALTISTKVSACAISISFKYVSHMHHICMSSDHHHDLVVKQ